MRRILKRDLEAWLDQARAERSVAVEALKTIALDDNKHQRLAHDTLKKMGLMPLVVDVNCPPNVIYAMKGDTGLPVSDYF